MLWIFIIFLFHKQSTCLQAPPLVECLETGMRINFTQDQLNDTTTKDNPVDNRPFSGHVYVKGFFFSRRCHLDYTTSPIQNPFTFTISYRGGSSGADCQVKRVRVPSGQEPESVAGITYSLVIVVQHHRLFVTNRDKAYSITCFYRDQRNKFEQQLQVGDLTNQPIVGVDRVPTCTYRVLSAGDGNPVKFANIGDQLIHSFRLEEMGMLVHSCFVRDGLGSEFSLVDERGCVTDTSLLLALTYNDVLNVSTAPISAFKFADQMVVYFSCQLTLCDKKDNGCEGITPPTCNMIPLPTEGGAPMPTTQRPDVESDLDGSPLHVNLFGGGFPTPNLFERGNYPAYEYVYQGVRQPTPTNLPSGWINQSRSLGLASHDYPASQSIFHAGVADVIARYKKDVKDTQIPSKNGSKILLNVAAERLIVFTKDEDYQDRAKLESAVRELDGTPVDASSMQTLWICAILVVCVISGAAIFLQHNYYHRQLLKLTESQHQQNGFSPSMELTGIWSQGIPHASVAQSPSISSTRRFIQN